MVHESYAEILINLEMNISLDNHLTSSGMQPQDRNEGKGWRMSFENNDLAVSFWKQGKLCVERSEFDKAIKHFDEAVRLAPRSAHIRRSLHDAHCSIRTRGAVGRLENLKLIKLKAQLLVEAKRNNWSSVIDLATAAQAIDP